MASTCIDFNKCGTYVISIQYGTYVKIDVCRIVCGTYLYKLFMETVLLLIWNLFLVICRNLKEFESVFPFNMWNMFD